MLLVVKHTRFCITAHDFTDNFLLLLTLKFIFHMILDCLSSLEITLLILLCLKVKKNKIIFSVYVEVSKSRNLTFCE